MEPVVLLGERELPLFPLNVVLFPGMPLPLNVFEPRYQQMMGDVLDRGDGRFGVVLIKEGVEVGGPATPYDIGTVAKVIAIRQGSVYGPIRFVAQGEHRFRIRHLLLSKPYLWARVEVLEEDLEDVPPELVNRTRQAFIEYLDAKSGATDVWLRETCERAEATGLSALIASHLEATDSVKQDLLETLSCQKRLTREQHLLVHETNLLQLRPPSNPSRTRFSPN
jgi:Lon protease-like protein